jgi:hypothetical protein
MKRSLPIVLSVFLSTVGFAADDSGWNVWAKRIADSIAERDAVEVVEDALASRRTKLAEIAATVEKTTALIESARKIAEKNEAEDVRELAKKSLEGSQRQLESLDGDAKALRKEIEDYKTKGNRKKELSAMYQQSLDSVVKDIKRLHAITRINEFASDVTDIRLKTAIAEIHLDDSVEHGLYLRTKLERLINAPEICQAVANCQDPATAKPVGLGKIFAGPHRDSLDHLPQATSRPTH